MITNLILLTLLTLASLWAVLRGSLIRSAIALAVASIILTIIMFRLNSPLAAVFELSVCAGLITVIFMSTISLTKPMTREETLVMTGDRIKRFWYLPVILVAVSVILTVKNIPWDFMVNQKLSIQNLDIRHIIWNLRQNDLLGQIIILLAGVFGVVALFKYKPDKPSDSQIQEDKKNE